MLEPTSYNSDRILNLFRKYDYQVSVKSTIQGKLKGELYVDDLKAPSSGVLLNPEGVFIAGNPTNHQFNQRLSDYLENIIHTGKHPTIEETDDLWFYLDDPQWQNSFPDIFKSRTPFKVGRINFNVKLPAMSWEDRLPKGYAVHKVDTSLDLDSLDFPDDVWDWIKHNVTEYLERGFGAVLTKGTKVISWSNADCAIKDRCEIGIITSENERRKGFGSLTVLAALDFCYQMGFREVGWHCEAHNWGSIATAEKVGFEKAREYYGWVCKFDLDVHVKEKAIVEKYYP